jgi:hypothetical protein
MSDLTSMEIHTTVEHLEYLMVGNLSEDSEWFELGKTFLVIKTYPNVGHILIEFLGIEIWDNETDDREYLDEDKDIQVSLSTHLTGVIEELIAIIKVAGEL